MIFLFPIPLKLVRYDIWKCFNLRVRYLEEINCMKKNLYPIKRKWWYFYCENDTKNSSYLINMLLTSLTVLYKNVKLNFSLTSKIENLPKCSEGLGNSFKLKLKIYFSYQLHWLRPFWYLQNYEKLIG